MLCCGPTSRSLWTVSLLSIVSAEPLSLLSSASLLELLCFAVFQRCWSATKTLSLFPLTLAPVLTRHQCQGRYDMAHCLCQPEDGKCQIPPGSSFPELLQHPPFYTLLSNFSASILCLHYFTRKNESPSFIEMRGIFSKWAAAVVRCDWMGELSSDEAYCGLDHHQVM